MMCHEQVEKRFFSVERRSFGSNLMQNEQFPSLQCCSDDISFRDTDEASHLFRFLLECLRCFTTRLQHRVLSIQRAEPQSRHDHGHQGQVAEALTLLLHANTFPAVDFITGRERILRFSLVVGTHPCFPAYTLLDSTPNSLYYPETNC